MLIIGFAEGAAPTGGGLVPTTSPHDMLAAAGRGFGVVGGALGIVVIAVLVLHPFPYISVYVV
jgi:hypothetical protein